MADALFSLALIFIVSSKSTVLRALQVGLAIRAFRNPNIYSWDCRDCESYLSQLVTLSFMDIYIIDQMIIITVKNKILLGEEMKEQVVKFQNRFLSLYKYMGKPKTV